MIRIVSSLELPAGFRPRDILAFHRRDAQRVSEIVEDDRLEKGMIWRGMPARLSIQFHPGRADARIEIDVASTRPSGATRQAFANLIRRMLGLTQRIEDFEAQYRLHPELGPVIVAQSGLRVPVAASPFEALTWAVTGQQISVTAAVSLRRRLIQAADLRLADGLLCYPEADQVAALNESVLRQAGFSTAKAQTLLLLARQVVQGNLPLDDWAGDLPPIDELRARLLTVRGIGPWTVNYTLLRGFGWLDGSLHGDVAVRRSLQSLLRRDERIGEAEAQAWLAPFSPWRALVGAHLWARLAATDF